ncbi:hypothetical protein Hanom_Chr16g01461601 [Helianthus anomalus]
MKAGQPDAPTQTVQVTSATGESAATVHKETTTVAGGAGAGGNVRSGAFAARHAGAGSQSSMPHPPIGPKDTLGDIYYKTRSWSFLFRARTHDGLYHAYVVGEANTRAANNQIVREWRTMLRERGDWEKYRERLLRQVKDFEKMKNSFAEEKAAFEAEKKNMKNGGVRA